MVFLELVVERIAIKPEREWHVIGWSLCKYQGAYTVFVYEVSSIHAL
jgi:hypothetical protein